MAIKEVKLELLNDKGELVVYKTNFISARKVRQALEVNAMAEKEDASEVETVDAMVNYVAGIIDGVTPDMIWDGLASWDLMETITRVMGEVLGTDVNLKVSP